MAKRNRVRRVDDAAWILERLVRLALTGVALPPAINVAGPAPVSVRRFAEELGRAVGITPRLTRSQSPRGCNLIADVSLLHSVVRPQYTPLSEAVVETCRDAIPAAGGPDPCR